MRLISSLLLVSACAAAQMLDPEPCTGDCFIHDPALIQSSNGTYYLYGSGPGVTVKTAPALTGPWTPPSRVFDTDDQLGAPDVQKVGHTFWLYYQRTIIGTNQSNISVASTTDLSRPWTDHGLVDIPPDPDYNRIDANLLVLDEGKELYLGWGSFWQNFFQFRMTDPKTPQHDTLAHLALNKTGPLVNTGQNPSEGMYSFFWKGWHYLFFSSGNCCHTSAEVPLGDEYKIMVCRSEDVSGTYFDKAGKNCLTENGGTLLLGTHYNQAPGVYAPGGQGIRFDETEKRVTLYYHWLQLDNQTRRAEFGYNYLGFDDEGWPVVEAK